MQTQVAQMDFTLEPETLSFSVAVRLHRSGERWVARVVARGEERVGLGPSARRALTAALEPLGTSAVTLLLADLGLLAPSVRVVQIDGRGA